MDHHQRELRQAAAKAFKQSLDQLADCFQPEELSLTASDRLEIAPEKPEPVETNLSLQALEEAAADIEAFMRSQNP